MSNALLVIDQVQIRRDAAGRYCLNDLHKAAGNDKNDMPSNWLRSKQAQDLVTELNSSDLRSSPIDTVEGCHGGTFVVKEMVYAYAMWISAAFQLKVIKAYDALAMTRGVIEQQQVVIEDKTQRIRDRALRGVMMTPKRRRKSPDPKGRECQIIGNRVAC